MGKRHALRKALLTWITLATLFTSRFAFAECELPELSHDGDDPSVHVYGGTFRVCPHVFCDGDDSSNKDSIRYFSYDFRSGKNDADIDPLQSRYVEDIRYAGSMVSIEFLVTNTSQVNAEEGRYWLVVPSDQLMYIGFSDPDDDADKKPSLTPDCYEKARESRAQKFFGDGFEDLKRADSPDAIKHFAQGLQLMPYSGLANFFFAEALRADKSRNDEYLTTCAVTYYNRATKHGVEPNTLSQINVALDELSVKYNEVKRTDSRLTTNIRDFGWWNGNACFPSSFD